MNCKEEDIQRDISDLGKELIHILFFCYINDLTFSFHLCLQFFYGLFHSSLGLSAVLLPLFTHSQRPALTSFLLDLITQAWLQGSNRISSITELRLFQALALVHPDYSTAMSTATTPLFPRLHRTAVGRRALPHRTPDPSSPPAQRLQRDHSGPVGTFLPIHRSFFVLFHNRSGDIPLACSSSRFMNCIIKGFIAMEQFPSSNVLSFYRSVV